MTHFQPPTQAPSNVTGLESQEDLFQAFESGREHAGPLTGPLDPTAPAAGGPGNGDRPQPAPANDGLEQEIEQVTAAAMTLEEHLGKVNGSRSPELQQSVEQILQFCQGLSERLDPQDSLQSAWLQQQCDRVAAQIRQSQGQEAIFQTATQALQQILKADRVLIYQFDGNDQGQVVMESLVAGWTPSLAETLPTVTFGPMTRQHYQNQPVVAIANMTQAQLSPYQRQLMDRFQVQASASCAVVIDNQIWGLLVVQQCRQPHSWRQVELDLLRQVAREVAIALQLDRAETLTQDAEQWGQNSVQLLYRITSRTLEMAREATSIDRVLEFTCRELRRQVKADRVGVYRFNADWSGQFISEDKGSEWVPVVGVQDLMADRDTHLQETQGGRYRNNESFRVDDIYAVGHADCHIQILEEFQARAYVLAPIFCGPQLWGLLGVYQNTGPRQWEDRVEAITVEVAAQLGVALQEADYARSLQSKIAREAFISRIIDQIRRGAEVLSLSRLVCQEMRRVLECDRVVVYRFNPDWTGEFIAESVGSGWVSVMELQSRNPLMYADISQCGIRDLEISTAQMGMRVDTHIQRTQGKAFRDDNPFFCQTSDIYQESFPPCYQEVMESYEARAYVIGIICEKSGKPWGMLAAYQCSDTREWTSSETDIVVQLSNQLSITVQQAEYIRELEQTSRQLADTAEREKQEREELQQQIIRILTSVRPALDGDLTVRAPVTENLVGTVADAYNNTIQSLRQLVAQVKTAALQVDQTSENSQTAIAQMAEQTQRELTEINQALNQIQAMVNVAKSVATSAEQVNTSVQQANQIVQNGDQAMNRTVEGIAAIRETVAETTQKIKRLSEASQKISRVVSLIQNFTTQTNLLALNAAIEATRAGEYGRGFAVVADEVRLLSQQSAEATAEIERLVQEIQSETSAVSAVMDVGIEQVVKGTSLVTETRQTLNDIVNSTAQISELIHTITTASQTQNQQSETVIQIMNRLADTALQTSDQSAEINQSFRKLLSTSEALQSSVGRFKVD
ncbi:MAG: GAF domain-containing protein [Elainellaceae cyanobacterium]